MSLRRASTLKRAPSPSWLGEAVFYQVYPQSFADSNGDGIGDLPGLIRKLDYLKDLGVTALWLNPIFDSPFRDAGYDVRDYCSVARRYGTLSDAKQLFREAHRRGMRVILDLVAGHTSVDHPWFRSSASGERNQFSDYFIWSGSVWEDPGEGTWIGGGTERDGKFLANFFAHQPALNYGYAKPSKNHAWQQSTRASGPTAVRGEMKRIMRFWLQAGCDGFRVDMANSLVRGDERGKGLQTLWRDFRSWLSLENPEAVLVAEWGNPREAVAAGFDVDFLLHFGEPAYNALFGALNSVKDGRRDPAVFFQRKGGRGINVFLKNFQRHLKCTRGFGFIAMPTGNHDYPRLSRGRSPDEVRVAHTLLLTLPTVPFIYYGDEIGMRYLENLPSKEGSYCQRTGSRTPMQWTSGRTAGFSQAPSRKLYLPLDADPDRPDVASQAMDPRSHLNFMRRLLSVRRAHPALGVRGAFRAVYAVEGRYPFVYERRLGQDRWWIAVNPSGDDVSIELDVPRGVKAVGEELVHRSRVSLRTSHLRLTMKSASLCLVRLLTTSAARKPE